MRTLAVLVVLLLSAQIGSARADIKEIVDIATVTFPDGWQRTAKERTFVLYENTDVAAGTLCRLYAMVSADSTGGLDGDFDAEWKTAAVDSYGIKSSTPIKARAIKGWSSRPQEGRSSTTGVRSR